MAPVRAAPDAVEEGLPMSAAKFAAEPPPPPGASGGLLVGLSAAVGRSEGCLESPVAAVEREGVLL